MIATPPPGSSTESEWEYRRSMIGGFDEVYIITKIEEPETLKVFEEKEKWKHKNKR